MPRGHATPKTIEGLELVAIRRRTNSASGNPRWAVTFRENAGTREHLTATDSQVNLLISESSVGKFFNVTTVYGEVTGMAEVD